MKPFHFVSIFLMLASTLVLAQNPVPFVDQPLVPAAVIPGGAGFTLTVVGMSRRRRANHRLQDCNLDRSSHGFVKGIIPQNAVDTYYPL